MKRALSTLLVLIMLCLLAVPAAVAAEEPYLVTMVISGEKQQEDHQRIMDSVNEILRRDLNMELDLIVLPWGSAREQKRLMLTSGEPLDLMLTNQEESLSYLANGQLNDLDELIDKYGTNIKATFGEEFYKSADIGGFIYGVPCLNEIGNVPCIGMRKDLVDKYNIDVSSIKTLEDMGPIFEIIKQNEPGISPLHVSADQPPAKQLGMLDLMTDEVAVLPDAGLDSTEIIAITDSEQYRNTLNTLHDWFMKGYINQDAATSSVSFESAFRAGDNFAAVMIWHPISPSSFGGKEMVYAMLGDHIARSGATGVLDYAIPINSKDPDKAMQMLDYLYGSPEVLQLLNWGQEGVDYVYTDKANNLINYPDGVTAETAKYHAQYAYNLPNQFLTSSWEGVYKPGVFEELKKFNTEGQRSKAFGFAFNPEGMENQLTALMNVKEKYKSSLDTGSVDPEVYIPQFAQELEQNGIRELIAAKQAQYDAWLGAQGK